MTNTGRKGTVVLMGVLAMLVPGRASAQDGPVATSDQREATIVLHVVNLAAISREVLNQVKEHVAMVYEDIGVRTVWVDSEQAVGKHVDGGLHLTVMLLPRDNVEKNLSGRASRTMHSAELTPASGAPTFFATAFRRCPDPSSLRFSSAQSSLTKWAISCCPQRAIRASGIMRASVDVQHPTHLPSFEKSQANSIRTMLLEPSAGAAWR